MSRFVKTLALFVAGLQLVPSKAIGAQSNVPSTTGDDDLKGVTLQPLNGKFDNLFAGHTSHSSHRSHSSHSSHYSGSSGSASPYVAPAMPAPAARSPAQSLDKPTSEAAPNAASALGGSYAGAAIPSNSTSPPVSSTRPTATHAGAVGDNSVKREVPMSLAEKLRLQIIRVQIRLNSLGLYKGAISGKFDAETRAALRLFQRVKSLPENGRMTTPTLNALGIPAVN